MKENSKQEKILDNFKLNRYLKSVYKSLMRPMEINSKEGKVSDGFFGGLDHKTGEILVYNLCGRNEEINESRKRVNFKDMKYFVVRDINKDFLKMKQRESRSEKVEHDQFDKFLKENDLNDYIVKTKAE